MNTDHCYWFLFCSFSFFLSSFHCPSCAHLSQLVCWRCRCPRRRRLQCARWCASEAVLDVANSLAMAFLCVSLMARLIANQCLYLFRLRFSPLTATGHTGQRLLCCFTAWLLLLLNRTIEKRAMLLLLLLLMDSSSLSVCVCVCCTVLYTHSGRSACTRKRNGWPVWLFA